MTFPSARPTQNLTHDIFLSLPGPMLHHSHIRLLPARTLLPQPYFPYIIFLPSPPSSPLPGSRVFYLVSFIPRQIRRSFPESLMLFLFSFFFSFLPCLFHLSLFSRCACRYLESAYAKDRTPCEPLTSDVQCFKALWASESRYRTVFLDAEKSFMLRFEPESEARKWGPHSQSLFIYFHFGPVRRLTKNCEKKTCNNSRLQLSLPTVTG